MTVPAYATDLTDITTCDSGTFSEFTNMTSGGTPGAETDYYIQGSGCQSATGYTKAGYYCSISFDNGTGITVPSGGAVLFWHWFGCPTSLETFANGGMRGVIGSAIGVYKAWAIGGRDKAPMPYGGWVNGAVDPTLTQDWDYGSPAVSMTLQFFGVAVYLYAGVSRGNIHAIDAIRYGRCEIRATYGEAANYATFAGMAAKNDANDGTAGYNRWGLFSSQGGTYLWKGLMSLGLAATVVDFRDSNRVIFVDDTRRVGSAFNKIEINNASSRVDWTNIQIAALGTVSKGAFEMKDAADVNFDSCQFTDMNTFIFLSTGDVLNSIFRRCAQITMPGGKMNGTQVLESTVAADGSAVVWDVATDPDGYLDNMTFSKGTNAHHAINFGTSSPTSITLRGMTTSGFNASNGQNDSTFYVARTTGAVTINIVGGSGNFTYKTAGAAVSIVIDPVTTKITVKNMAGTLVSDARVLVEAGDGTGDLPFEESVTISRLSSTATVAHTGHGLVTGDKVVIRGANQPEYNGVFTITYISADSYSYTVSGTPDTPATGTITATGAILEGVTVLGVIQATRSFSVDQNVRGTARKTTSVPYYKISDFTDVVDSVDGLTKTVQLIYDQ